MTILDLIKALMKSGDVAGVEDKNSQYNENLIRKILPHDENFDRIRWVTDHENDREKRM